MIGITEQISIKLQIGLAELKTVIKDLSTSWKVELIQFLHEELGENSPYELKTLDPTSEEGFQQRLLPVEELEGICKDEDMNEDELINQLKEMD